MEIYRSWSQNVIFISLSKLTLFYDCEFFPSTNLFYLETLTLTSRPKISQESQL